MACCFVYVSGGMMCKEDIVLNRSVYNKYLFEAFHFLMSRVSKNARRVRLFSNVNFMVEWRLLSKLWTFVS